MLVIEINDPSLSEAELLESIEAVHKGIDEFFAQRSVGCSCAESYQGMDSKWYCKYCLKEIEGTRR